MMTSADSTAPDSGRSESWHLVYAAGQLIRLPQVMVVLFATWIGAAMAEVEGPRIIQLMMCSMAALFAGSVAINDFRDIAEDRLNAPHRPLVRNSFPRSAALAASVLLFLIGVVTASAVSVPMGLLAVSMTVLSLAYTFSLKDVPLVGNFVVAMVSTGALACWAAHVDVGPLFWTLAAALLFIRLGGELLKTAQDAVGDAQASRRTLATVWNVRAVQIVGLTILSIGLLVAILPAVYGKTNTIYIVSLGLCVALTMYAFLSVRYMGAGSLNHVVAIERGVMILLIVAAGIGLPEHQLPALL